MQNVLAPLMLVAEVVPDIPVTGIEESYTYEVPDELTLVRGDAVLVPFGGRTVVGYVAAVKTAETAEFGFKLKPVASKIAGLALPESLMELLEFMGAEFLATPGACVAAAMPPGVRSRLATAFQIVSGTPSLPSPKGGGFKSGDEVGLPPAQREALNFIKDKGGRIRSGLRGEEELCASRCDGSGEAGVAAENRRASAGAEGTAKSARARR